MDRNEVEVHKHAKKELGQYVIIKLLKPLRLIIIITLFQEGDIYITIVNHDGPQNNRNNITIKISLV